MQYEGEPYGDGGAIRLVPFEDRHFLLLVEICEDREYALDDRFGDAGEFFEKLIEAPNSMFFGVDDAETGEELGIVYISSISAGLDAWSNGYGVRQHLLKPIQAFRFLADWAFSNTNIQALHTEHCLLNKAVSALAIRTGYKLDGIVPKSRIHGGTIYDTSVFSLTRERWEENHGRR